MGSEIAAQFRLAKWFPHLSKDVVDKLAVFNQELAKSNEASNLVSPKSLPFADLVHFADALLAFEAVYKKINKNIPLYDIASGGGFPGLVIAIAYSDVQVVLVEPDQRRCEFLRHVIATTKIKNASVAAIQAESLEEDSVEQAICRGYTSLSKAFLALRKPFKVGSVMYFMKGNDWPLEVSQVPTQLCSIWTPALFHQYKLPTTESIFYVVAATKIS